MKRDPLIAFVALAILIGSLVAAWGTLNERDDRLRGYVDPTTNADLPFRIPRFGVNAELTQYTPEELNRQLALMREGRVEWVRQFVRWDEIEREPGEYDWTTWDALITPFEGDSLRLVAVLMNSPEWGRESGSNTAPPTDPVAFARFAAAFAGRYGSVIDVYQIWDEPNITLGWGELEPRPADYAALLREAYSAIHGADANATVIAAALAPTTEISQFNISDVRYLQDLYALGAADFMDAAAAKPYGFSLPPDDRTVSPDTLNFSRIVALREVMIANGDGEQALWASSWGWNSLSADWSGSPSIWGQVSAEQRTAYTLAALDRADREWAWLGGMILHHWQPDAPPDDPQWGFALIDQQGEPTPLWSALTERSDTRARDGLYPASNPYARYSGVWTFGELGADIGWVQDSQFDFDFTGSDVALLLRQGDYLAFLYPTIDGLPANAAPRDAAGNAFINLKSGTELPETNLVPVARGLPYGEHTLHVTADRGWDRWAIAGFAVSSGDLAAPYSRQLAVAIVTAIAAAISTAISLHRLDWSPLTRRFASLWRRLGDLGQLLAGVVTSIALMIGMLLTWGDPLPSIFRREPVQIGAAIATAGLIYLQPHFVLTVIACVVLFVIVYNRLELGLTLTVFYAPLFLFPVELFVFAFPMSELVILITGAAWVLRALAEWGQRRREGLSIPAIRLTTLDLAVLAWLILGVVSLAWAEQTGRAVTELRVLIVEPILFYAILRTRVTDQRGLLRLVDALLIAGVVVALVGLFQFARGESVITAEAGARRLASVYGSPNNVGLILGRCIPFALAFALAPIDPRRRVAALIALALMGLAALLSQSAGAIFLGIPAAIVVVLLMVLRRRARLALIGLIGAGAAAFALAMQFPRFARVFDLGEGTSFFRVRVWQSALQMIDDRPITGLGLDQFLYAFRGRYMLPDAWQEPDLSHPHNLILDWWTRLGIFGVAVFVWIQAAFWRRAVRLYRARRDAIDTAIVVGMMGSMANLLAHGLVDNSVFVNDLSYVFVLLLGLAANLDKDN